MMEYFDILIKNPLFSGYTEKETKAALEAYRASISHYKKGDVIFVGVKRLEKFGVVVRGSIQVCADDIDGNKTIMATVEAPQSFGESICVLDIEESGIFIQAFEDCSVIWLNPKNITEQMQKQLTALIAKRTLQMNARIQILSKLTIREKLSTFFAERVKQCDDKSFDIAMSREDMAIYLGTNRSALCRELSKMKAEKIIDFHGKHFTVLH